MRDSLDSGMNPSSVWTYLLMIGAAGVAFAAQGRVPRFQDYPATARLQGAPVPPKLSPDDERLRTALRRGAARGPNFAGAYTVVIWGCGTSCQSGAVIDARTGRVWSLPHSFVRGADFRLASRLFVADPVPPQPQPYESPYVTYYEWRDTAFVLIDSLRAPSQ
jgi:hypothetical protein